MLAPSLRKRDRSWLLAAYGLPLGISVLYASQFQAFPALKRENVAAYLLLGPGAQNVAALLPSSSIRARLREDSADNLRPDLLPSEWRKAIGNSIVSALPWEISLAAANNLNWKPIPTLQLYSAYTAKLDRLTATAIETQGAKYLIVAFTSIDGRNMVLDNSLVWRTIFSTYGVVAFDSSSQQLLLARKSVPSDSVPLKELTSGQSRLGTWRAVPNQNKLLYVSLNIEPSILGHGADLLYQLPPLYLEVQRTSGAVSTYRLLSKTASNGVLLNDIPDNGLDLAALLRGHRARDPVVRFRIARVQIEPWFKQQFNWKLLVDLRSIADFSLHKSAPLTTDVSLAEGHGRSASLEISAVRPDGIDDVNLLQVLVNNDLTGVHSCYLSYEVSRNRLWLIADIGYGSAGVGKPGDATTLENSQCRVALGQAKVSVSETEIRLKVQIEFRQSFAGSRQVFVLVKTSGQIDAGWSAKTRWFVN